MLRLSLTACFLLGACAATTDMSATLDPLVGKPWQNATVQLGQPSYAEQAGIDMRYIWVSSRTIRQMPVGSGNLGGGAAGMAFSIPGGRNEATCAISLVVNPAGLVRNWSVREDSGGCKPKPSV